MAKVILICGKICSGKSTYAKKLGKENQAVILSVDEIMLSVFGQDVGEKHDNYVRALKKYLFSKSVELIEIGVNVILDMGMWSKSERDKARDFYNSRNITNEIHYLDISDIQWQKRIEKRNNEISKGDTLAYFIDKGLAEKVNKIFEKPEKSEIDVWIKI